MKILVLIAATASMAALSGCASHKSADEDQAAQRSQYTEEEKAAMTHEEKVAAYNSEAEDKEQLVCRRERAVGTHFQRTRCYTRKELEEAQQAARDTLQDIRGNPLEGGN